MVSIMSENVDFMSWFKTNYSQRYYLEICPPPTYLAQFISPDENMIFIHNLKNRKTFNAIGVSTPTEDSFSDVILDLTGSPLAVGLDNDTFNDSDQQYIHYWLKHEEKHEPVQIDVARNIINIYNNSEKTLNVGGIFIVCDQGDFSKAVILGSSSDKRFLSTHMVVHTGFHSRSEDCLNLNVLMTKHQKLASWMKNVTPKIEIRCIYEIFGSSIINPNCLLSSKNSSVSLEVEWNQLQYGVPDDATATVSNVYGSFELNSVLNKKKILIDKARKRARENLENQAVKVVQCCIGNCHSEAILLASDLEQLQKYIDIIEDENADELFQKGNDFMLPVLLADEKDVDLITKITDVFQRVDEVKQLRRLAQNKIQNPESLFQATSNNFMRSNFDFTDSIWLVLTKCTKYSELSECFDYIFKEIAENNYNPYLNDDNQTRIATLIRNVQTGVAVIKSLTGPEPILMLIEIGIEKMRKDYLYIHVSLNLPIAEYMSLQSLVSDPETDHSKSRKSILPIEARRKSLAKPRQSLYGNLNETGKKLKLDLNSMNKQMARLASIHSVLEILLLVETNLPKLSSTTFCNLAEEAFRIYTGPKSPITTYCELQAAPFQVFKYRVPTKEVALGDKDKIWNLSITSENNYAGVKSVFLQSAQSIFPPCLMTSDYDNSNDTSNNCISEMYYCTEYSHTYMKFGP